MQTATRRPTTLRCPYCYGTLHQTAMVAGPGIDPRLRLFVHKPGSGACHHELWVITQPKG